MLGSIAAAIALLIAACLPPTASPSSSATSTLATATPSASPSTARVATPPPSPSPTPTPAPAGYTSPRGTITIDQPRAFASVTSPVTVSGTASLFEGAFTWRLADLSGKELATGTGQASPGAPAKGTFSFSVTFSATTTTYAYISVISHSAKDGSVDDEARVPIVLVAR
jgi:hypothetical protein